MADETASTIAEVLRKRRQQLLESWLRRQLSASATRPDMISQAELTHQSRDFLDALERGVEHGRLESIRGEEWQPLRELVADLSRNRALRGFTPTETATFVFSFKQPLFEALQQEVGSAEVMAQALWDSTNFLDQLGLYTTEVYQASREEVIRRQQQELLELSTPVVKLWDGVLAVPLIGTLDSARTQIVMESLLGRIVETGASLAIIDITGVPTVDTLVAQHLIKTLAAARLMGADCIISGIRPQIAQTMVQLGVELEGVVTKATLADAFAVALRKLGFSVERPQLAPARS